MSLKTTKIIYRVATIALALFILPGLFFMNSEMAVEGMNHVGLTDTIRLKQLLGYASPVGILVIILGSFFPKIFRPELKERAYAGIAFIYLGAFWAHLQLGDTPAEIMMPIVTFIILMTSHYTRHRITDMTK